jgi:hypothetical protein
LHADVCLMDVAVALNAVMAGKGTYGYNAGRGHPRPGQRDAPDAAEEHAHGAPGGMGGMGGMDM